MAAAAVAAAVMVNFLLASRSLVRSFYSFVLKVKVYYRHY